MLKTPGVTIHPLGQVYQDTFDHLEMQISKFEQKGMQWKLNIHESLMNAQLKAVSYSGKTESPRGLLFAIRTCLNRDFKLNAFDNEILMPVRRLSIRSHIKRSS